MTTTYKNRYINRGILDDQEINAGGLIARDLAIGLTLLADDQGRLTAAVRWIWKEVFKHQDDVSLQATRKAFNHLGASSVRFIQLYRFGDDIYLQIRNWHKFQPQKVDRFKWSHLPSPPDWSPEKYLPPRLLEKWKEDEKVATFSPPPISNEWISGDTPETQRSRDVSADGDTPEPSRTPRRRRSGALARVGVDKGKSGQSGRVDDKTRGDVARVEQPVVPPVPDSPVRHHSNGGPAQWSDWPTLNETKRRLLLTNWLFAKHSWQSVQHDTLQHEHGIAEHIAALELDGVTLLKHLEAWWNESDPSDRPSSLEYFWTRLQVLEGDRIKQVRRPRVRTEGLSRISPSLPSSTDRDPDDLDPDDRSTE